ncbi:MAG: ECF transporter S component, partial [Oscillospiraceae bacterium]|nr:ECF transporter S component [Oscillospiraceae bacterium]
MNNGKKAGGTQRMAGLAIFTALIVVLTVLCTFVKFGPVSITLALAPIVIGAALYGAGAGAYLGFVFSLVVLLTGLFGWDGGFILMLFDMKWYGLILTVLVKGTAAGYAAGLVYRLLCRKSEKAAVLAAG